MTRLSERIVDSRFFKRRKATEDTKRKIANWAIWGCADPEFQYAYERRVSLYVHQGRAELTFSDGEVVDLQPGDFLTIEQGASAIWKITEPIRNSYCYHDAFEYASRRASQMRWQGE
ncbi:cupin domain-containing protein [Pseudomonas benzenivorans]|uniref:Cupin domain-containing protein n=1 Tax=Pseudomonas benzenivorans TaxID=556533 RepID=A0ABY5H6X6_9PSED|nr:cupin domain-containing protein [Pseudomonas benzenivorans]UTW08070.1 cupin domain-containing protein [Pseudomonas benzenivorans]